VLRLIDCCERKRLTNYRIKAGNLTLVVGETTPETPGQTTELDDWMSKHAG
jgi:GH24 family phage-related lysozyme (muramidase)